MLHFHTLLELKPLRNLARASGKFVQGPLMSGLDLNSRFMLIIKFGELGGAVAG